MIIIEGMKNLLNRADTDAPVLTLQAKIRWGIDTGPPRRGRDHPFSLRRQNRHDILLS